MLHPAHHVPPGKAHCWIATENCNKISWLHFEALIIAYGSATWIKRVCEVHYTHQSWDHTAPYTCSKVERLHRKPLPHYARCSTSGFLSDPCHVVVGHGHRQRKGLTSKVGNCQTSVMLWPTPPMSRPLCHGSMFAYIGSKRLVFQAMQRQSDDHANKLQHENSCTSNTKSWNMT